MEKNSLILNYIDREISLKELLISTGGNTYFPNCDKMVLIPRKVIATDDYLLKIPREAKEGVEIIFFSPNLEKDYISFEDILNEYKAHQLMPVDVYSLAAANKEKNYFSYYNPNLTYWIDKKNNFHVCYFCELAKIGFREEKRRWGSTVSSCSDFNRFVVLKEISGAENALENFRTKNLLLAGAR
jgi:hypothetical protein